MNEQVNWRTLAIGCASIMVSTGISRAAIIVDPVSATASSYYAPDDRAPVHTIDYSGLSSSTGLNTGDPIPSSYPTDGTTAGGNMWLTNGSGSAGSYIQFDLGSVYSLDGFHLWNYNEVSDSVALNNRGVNSVTFTFSNDDVDFSTLPAQSMTVAEAPGTTTYAGDDYSLTPVSAQYVRLTVNSDYGDGSYTGISEIRFAAVPEPASLSLLALGLPCLLKRRRRSTATA